MLTVALLPLALSLQPLQSEPDPEQVFGDWAVVCDNAKHCSATALMPVEWLGDDSADGPTQMTIERDAGSEGAVTIDVRPLDDAGPLDVAIDGKQIAAGRKRAYRPAGEEAPAIVPLLVAGKELTLTEAGHKRVGRVSLAGLAASLRYMDAVQGRAGTVTALVAKGAKPATAVPAAPAIPRIAVVRPPAGEAARPSKAVVAAMMKAGQCESEPGPDGPIEPEYHALDAQATLALVPCGSGAYNFNSAVFVLRGGKPEPAKFDVQPGWLEGGDDVPGITNAHWDGPAGQLEHYDKARGLGDCGNEMSWAWDGARFRLITANRLEECRGAINWPRVFTAIPEWRN